ncbi:MAG: zinc-ribbon domain-containing protein [Pricia sp.]|nr:zinc-ribbon domain-containing protein [Pricia sp.]
MILFFGTRPGKSDTVTLTDVNCPYCNQTGTLTVSRSTNWFHLFWIKLFKVSETRVAECEHCKRVYFKDEFTEEMNRSLDFH